MLTREKDEEPVQSTDRERGKAPGQPAREGGSVVETRGTEVGRGVEDVLDGYASFDGPDGEPG